MNNQDIALLQNHALLGLDQLLKHINASAQTKSPGYPPHNLIRVDDENYLIELSVAGISKEKIEITQDGRELFIKYDKEKADCCDNSKCGCEASEKEYIHKGISERSFHRKFDFVDDYYEVQDASVIDGILRIKIFHNVPDSQKPKTIKIE